MYSETDGVHRHEYSETLKQAAANKFVAEQIEYRKSQEVTTSISISRTDVNTTDRAINAGVGTPIAGVQGSRTVTDGSEKTQGHESGPLTQSAIDEIKAWAEPYAKANPWVAGYTPDRLCKQSEPTCDDATAGKVKNESYTPAHKQNPADKASGSSDKKSPSRSDSSTPSKNTTNSSKTTDTGSSISVTDGGTWAGEPSKLDDGTLWADFSQDDPGNHPLGNCIFDAHRDQVEQRTDKTYDTGGGADARSNAEKKRDAEAHLKMGICDEKFYGRDYCVSWKKKRQMIDSAPGLLDDEQPRVTPGGARERPGYLHFDPYRQPVIIPDRGPKVLPGGTMIRLPIAPH
jgi:hypothetical protein